MSWKTILVLLVICAGLGAFVWKEGFEEPPGPANLRIRHLLTFDPETVEYVHLTFLDTSYVVIKEHGEWLMLEPHEGNLADSLTVNHLLRVLNKIIIRRSIPIDSIDLAMVHLDNPVLSFTVRTTKGDTLKVRFGVLNTTTENIYVRRNDEDKVLLIGSTVGPMLRIDSHMLRSKGLFNLRPYEISRIKYSRRGKTDLLLERSAETGQWWVEKDRKRAPGEKRVVLNLLFSLYSGQVREFHSLSAASAGQTGLTRPERRLRLSDVKGNTAQVAFGKTDGERPFLRWASASLYPENLLLLDSALEKRLDAFNFEGIRSLRMASFQSEEVDRIELSSPVDTIVIVAEDDTLWRIIEPEEMSCKLWQVERLLTHADTMGAKAVLSRRNSPAGRGFGHPQLTLSLYGGNELLASIEVGDYVGEKEIYMRDKLRNLDFLAAASQLERLNYTLKDLSGELVRHVVQ